MTLTVTDGSGNSSTCTSTVTVIDTVTPSALCQNITVYLDGSGNATITGADLDGGSTDNCSGTLAFAADITSFTCANIGANTVTLTVTDPGGNSDNCTSTVTVLDTISPTAVCQNITAYLDGTGNVSIVAADIDGGSTDNCSVSLGIDLSAFSCANIGSNTVTLIATDGSGNTSSCTSTVTIVDTISPVVSCQDLTVYLDAAGNASITAADVDNGSNDNCSSVSPAIDVSAFDCSMTGSNTVTLTVTDGTGNTNTCTSTVTVLDTISPTVVCQDITAYLDGTGNVSITAADVDNGSTDNCGTPTMSIDVSSFTCANTGANIVTLTGTDASGNTGNCIAIVTVLDTISPTVVCQDITAYLDGTGNVSITAADVDNGSTDNCGTPTMSINISSFTCANTGANTITLTGTDASGNTNSCTATVTVLDTISPTVVCQDITAYLDATGSVSITAADVDNGSSDNCGVPTMSIDVSSFTCANTGANIVTLTGIDASGNTNTCASIVTVLDTISPTVLCQDITAYLDGTGTVSITAADVDDGSTDNCGTPTMSIDVSAFDCSMTGANTVTLTGTDASGNTNTCTATVTVLDTISPTVVCQDIIAYLDGTGTLSITAADVDNGSTDNCGTPTMSINISSFTCANTGANTVTLTGTDASGNTNSCTATVTVLDTISPTVVCQDITAYLDATGSVSITAADVDNGSSDNCGVPTMSIDVSSFTCANTGANIVTLTGIDASGNTNTCASTVTVLDTISPTVVCQDLTAYLDGTGTLSITAADVDNGSTDNCGTPTMSIDVSAFDCSMTGANTVTLTGTDAYGNTNTCTATVTVLDTISPTTVCQDITAYLDGTGNVSITAADVDNGSTDNCGSPTMSIDVSVFDCSTTGANTVTLTGTDAGGNTSTCTATVTVLDTISPTVVCQDITAYLDGTGNVSIISSDVDGGSTDNCGVPTMSIDISAFDCSMAGANTVTLTGTDASGNTNTCTATVTVVDSIAPTFTGCPIDVVLTADQTGCSAIHTWTAPVESDNCGVTVTSSHNPGDTFTQGVTTVTYTATDASGNITLCSFNITVESDMSLSAAVQDEMMGLDGIIDLTVTGGVPNYTYDWSNSQTTEDLTGLAGNLTYTVIVTDDLGCMDTLDVWVQSFVKIEELGASADLDLIIFPNPASGGDFSVELQGDWIGEVTIEMVDTRGRLIYKDLTTDKILKVKLGELEPGTYYVRAMDEDSNILTTRLVTVND